MKEAINIEKLEYSYPDGTKALKGIDMRILEGESVGLIGPNGAGKSTLLLHLNGILRGSGKLKIMGLEMTDENLDIIRSKVGLVFQDPEDQLFMPTVFDDVAFGPVNMGLKIEEIKTLTRESLQKVNMSDSSDRISHHLSFGEKKRISLATVLSMKTEILALDEPSSNLDPKAKRDLMELLRNINVTKIIAGHDLGLILDICNRVILLDKGRIAADGDVKAILGDRSLMEMHGLEVPPSLACRPYLSRG